MGRAIDGSSFCVRELANRRIPENSGAVIVNSCSPYTVTRGAGRFPRVAFASRTTDYVYREVLGYDEARIERLRRAGHIGTTYMFEDDEPT